MTTENAYMAAKHVRITVEHAHMAAESVRVATFRRCDMLHVPNDHQKSSYYADVQLRCSYIVRKWTNPNQVLCCPEFYV